MVAMFPTLQIQSTEQVQDIPPKYLSSVFGVVNRVCLMVKKPWGLGTGDKPVAQWPVLTLMLAAAMYSLPCSQGCFVYFVSG
jgi:hypothetical protein